MLNKILTSLLAIFLCLLSATSEADKATFASGPEQVVAEFQKLPHYEMFCKDERWKGVVPTKFDEEYQSYFSKVFYKLFFWSSCGQPKVPPRYAFMENDFSYDIRFGIPFVGGAPSDLGQIVVAENIKITTIKSNNPAQSTVRVDFTYKGIKMSTRYTLIKEDGQWKIDDISPRSNFVGAREASDPDGNEIAEYSFSSDSIKAEMQKNYNAATARYNKEQAQKGIAPK